MKVLITCIPRCGSTYLFRSLAGFNSGSAMPRDYNGTIKKKHAFSINHPREDLVRKLIRKEGYKTIFLFGDIIDAVVSTKHRRYDLMHFRHCGCDENPLSVDIYNKDALNYEKMFDGWTQDIGYPLMALRYEEMFRYEGIISEFLGEKIKLLPWKQRTQWKAGLAPVDHLDIMVTYQNLINKVRNMPDYKIYRS